MARGALRTLVRTQHLTLLGASFIVGGNAIVYGDAGYPFASLAFLVVLALSMLATLVLFAPLSLRPGGRAAAFAIGATYFLDVMFLGSTRASAMLLVVLAVYLTYLIAWRGNRTVVRFTATAIGVCTLFALPQQALTNAHLRPEKIALAKPAANATGRPFVHIILDEMASLALMPHGPFYADLKARMIADYRKRGFDLFFDTRSEAGATIYSLGNVYAEADGMRINFTPMHDEFSYEVGQNGELDDLTRAGYSTSVLQSTYLETCRPDTRRCMTYAWTGDGSVVLATKTSALTRFEYALRGVNNFLLAPTNVRASGYYRFLTHYFLRRMLPSMHLYLAGPPLAVDLMGASADGLARIRPGQSVLMHFLAPHFPYVLDADCRLRDPAMARAPRWAIERISGAFDRAATERAYWEQVACVHDRLMGMIDAILTSPGGKDAIIVVHGDHGSRMLKDLPNPAHQAATEEERDYALNTHFAVRGLARRHGELAADTALRSRVWTVVNAVLERPDNDTNGALVTSAVH